MGERLRELLAMARMARAFKVGQDAAAMQLERFALVPAREFLRSGRGLGGQPAALFGQFLLRLDVFTFPTAGHGSILATIEPTTLLS